MAWAMRLACTLLALSSFAGYGRPAVLLYPHLRCCMARCQFAVDVLGPVCMLTVCGINKGVFALVPVLRQLTVLDELILRSPIHPSAINIKAPPLLSVNGVNIYAHAFVAISG